MGTPLHAAESATGAGRKSGAVRRRVTVPASSRAMEKRRAVQRHAWFSSLCQPASNCVRRISGKARLRSRQKDAEVGFGPPQRCAGIARHHPVAHIPSGAVHQRAQAGLRENPVIGFVALESVAAGQPGERRIPHVDSPVRGEARDGRGEQAVARARRQGFQRAEGVLQVVENAEEKRQAAAARGEPEAPVQIRLGDAHRRSQRLFAARARRACR